MNGTTSTTTSPRRGGGGRFGQRAFVNKKYTSSFSQASLSLPRRLPPTPQGVEDKKSAAAAAAAANALVEIIPLSPSHTRSHPNGGPLLDEAVRMSISLFPGYAQLLGLGSDSKVYHAHPGIAKHIRLDQRDGLTSEERVQQLYYGLPALGLPRGIRVALQDGEDRAPCLLISRRFYLNGAALKCLTELFEDGSTFVPIDNTMLSDDLLDLLHVSSQSVQREVGELCAAANVSYPVFKPAVKSVERGLTTVLTKWLSVRGQSLEVHHDPTTSPPHFVHYRSLRPMSYSLLNRAFWSRVSVRLLVEFSGVGTYTPSDEQKPPEGVFGIRVRALLCDPTRACRELDFEDHWYRPGGAAPEDSDSSDIIALPATQIDPDS